MRKHTFISAAILLGLTAALSCGQIVQDPLHGCFGSNCNDNGTNTPTSINPLPQFEFTASSGPLSGDFLIDVLVPDNEQTVGMAFTITGSQTAANNPSTASLFSTTDWTSGNLDTYLNINASPNNPIGAYLPSTKTYDALATGFSVYQADLGQNTLPPPGSPLSGPLLTLGGSPLPQGSYIVAFLLGTTMGNVATANSGALFETGTPPTPSAVPEPTSWLLFATLALGLVGMRWKTRTA